MKIVHVTRALIVNSGVSVFAAEMAGAQAELGHDVALRYTWKPEYPVNPKVDSRAFKSLDELGFVPDIVHVHALWLMDMVRAMRWCRLHNVPYVVSPHGGLMPRVFTKGWVKKRLFYWLFIRKNLIEAKAIHCTGEGEAEAVRKLGLKTPTFIAPLGCHLPDGIEEKKDADRKTILFLSRISEEKGLVYLLDAWKSIPHDNWRLVIAGPDWRGHLAMLQQKIQDEKIEDVEFPGAADAVMKDQLYRQADLFVLPSPMENFSMVVLDALAYGVPVICTKGTPWKVIEDNKCGWWIEPDSAMHISTALQAAMNLSEADRRTMGANARKLAMDYSWENLGRSAVAQYSI